VVSTTAGRPVAKPRPRARYPAARSSWWTWTANRGSDANATTIGVDREPGATTASVTPARAHSSTSVAQNVACSVTGTAPSEQITVRTSHTAGMALYAEVDGSGPRLVLLHGFAQNRNCWGPAAADLAADHEVVRIDLPGHGRSTAAADADLSTGARLIAAAGGPGTYIGYSMGGRFALHVALASPSNVHGLVLIGATGGIDDADNRVARVERDEALARTAEADGVEAFVDIWLAQPLFTGLSEPMQFRDERCTNSATALAASLRNAGTGTQEPLWDRLPHVDVPVLVVSGADDAKFAAEARRLVSTIGDRAELALIDGAGHSAHLERPAEFVARVRTWLADHHL
jgi:2-succinyl-6-hydroxy-2,4-cyclohexadiene-1-carboxylate synthase